MGYFTDYYPLGARIVTFRYDDIMTVPGKGGRPRKWRSDTDRVRAHRARLRGEEEPPTVDTAIDGDDEVALAWNRVRELERDSERLRQELKLSLASARDAKKALDHERTRFGWINDENTRLRAELEALRADRDSMRETDNAHTEAAQQPTARPATGHVGPNRAQRRREERRRRRGD